MFHRETKSVHGNIQDNKVHINLNTCLIVQEYEVEYLSLRAPSAQISGPLDAGGGAARAARANARYYCRTGLGHLMLIASRGRAH